MQPKKCLRTLASALIIGAALTIGGAARASTYKIIHNFRVPKQPQGNLTMDAAGNLYGTTFDGGAYYYGVVFKLAPNPDGTWTESVLHTFAGGADGAEPTAGLMFDAAGNLYGSTYNGGSDSTSCFFGGCGVVFKLKPNSGGTWEEHILHTFDVGAGGTNPSGGLTFDAAGNLYGTTSGNPNGTVFKLAPNPDGTWVESTLYSFFDSAVGIYPNGGLAFDAAGNLYGTTSFGGDLKSSLCYPGCGTVFELAPTSSGWSETVLRAFHGTARNPYAPVILDKKGNLYGTTSGGTGNFGVVFKITP
jgi:uncharacterized repeat protein (TIGR03803 family)